MRAIVLAAGQGTRLAPFTHNVPKCLARLCGRTLLDRARDSLTAAGIRDLWVVAGYRSDLIVRQNYRVVLNERFRHTNMVASLFSARHLIDGSTDTLICYGDIVFEARVVAALAQATGTLALAINREWQSLWSARMEDALADAETLKMDAVGRVTEIGRRPRCLSEIQGQYMGLIKLRADAGKAFVRAYDAMDRKAVYDGRDFDQLHMTTFLQHLIGEGWVVDAVEVRGGWLEIDTVRDLRLYEDLAAAGTLDRFCMLN